MPHDQDLRVDPSTCIHFRPVADRSLPRRTNLSYKLWFTSCRAAHTRFAPHSFIVHSSLRPCPKLAHLRVRWDIALVPSLLTCVSTPTRLIMSSTDLFLNKPTPSQLGEKGRVATLGQSFSALSPIFIASYQNCQRDIRPGHLMVLTH